MSDVNSSIVEFNIFSNESLQCTLYTILNMWPFQYSDCIEWELWLFEIADPQRIHFIDLHELIEIFSWTRQTKMKKKKTNKSETINGLTLKCAIAMTDDAVWVISYITSIYWLETNLQKLLSKVLITKCYNNKLLSMIFGIYFWHLVIVIYTRVTCTKFELEQLGIHVIILIIVMTVISNNKLDLFLEDRGLFSVQWQQIDVFITVSLSAKR